MELGYIDKIMNFIINYIPKTIHEHLIISRKYTNFTIINTSSGHQIFISEKGLKYIKYRISCDLFLNTLRITCDYHNYFDVNKASDEELTIAGVYMSLNDPYLYMDDLNNFNVIYNYICPYFKYNFKKNQLKCGYRSVLANFEHLEFFNKHCEEIQKYNIFKQNIELQNNIIKEAQQKINLEKEKLAEIEKNIENYKNKRIFNNSLNLIKNNDFKLKPINKSIDNDFVNEIIKYVQCRLYIKNDIEKIMDKETFINIYESVLRKDEFDLMTKYYDSNEELKTIIKSLC